ncbi:MAG TPA: hypothetical protein VLR27_01200 [Acidimicrobiales bacterium]|nr:hypothetical protein [Acidimicrobiales bacterium]
MQMQLNAFKRTLAMGAVWTVAMGGLLATSPAASGQEGVEPGLGNAYAQGIKVDPRSGRLSFGITYGMALAGHQNNVAVAESRSADLGVIGTTLGGEGCDGGDPTLPKEDQPQPLVARSTEEGAGEEKVESENGVEKRALASGEPLARSVAVTAASGEDAVLKIGATKSTTESGIIDGARVARAVTEVSGVSFAGGQVVLRGLRWEAAYQTAPTEATSGSFTIDGIEVAGEKLPIPEENPFEPLAEANAVLEPLGFRITPPTVRNESGIQFVDPMRIGIIPATARESVLGPVFNGIQPVRESVFDAIIEADCGNAAYITVLDLVLGSVSGAGSLGLELGGVTATSNEIAFTSFLGSLGDAPSLPPLSSGAGSSPSLSGSGSSPSLSGGSSAPAGAAATTPPTTVASAPADGGGGEQAAIADVEPLTGSRGGALAGVGLGGLALLAALAAADRAQMRRAQRSILMEVS